MFIVVAVVGVVVEAVDVVGVGVGVGAVVLAVVGAALWL